jgi:hypothetical protein
VRRAAAVVQRRSALRRSAARLSQIVAALSQWYELVPLAKIAMLESGLQDVHDVLKILLFLQNVDESVDHDPVAVLSKQMPSSVQRRTLMPILLVSLLHLAFEVSPISLILLIERVSVVCPSTGMREVGGLQLADDGLVEFLTQEFPEVSGVGVVYHD